MWVLLVLGVLGAWKLRPRHIGNDVLKVEVFKWLHGQIKRNEDVEYEQLERKWVLRFTGATFIVFGFTFLFLVNNLGISTTNSGMTSLAIALIFALLYWKRSKTFRTVTLPLYATLCRIPQARWDIRRSPRNWVKVDLNKGTVLIRLPKDWHPTKPALTLIREMVNARLAGHWKLTPKTAEYLVVCEREAEFEPIPVAHDPEDYEFTVVEKEVEDDGPW